MRSRNSFVDHAKADQDGRIFVFEFFLQSHFANKVLRPF